MENRDLLAAEALAEPQDRLRRQGNLRYEDEAAPPLGEECVKRSQIHLGLAAAGVPVEKNRLKLPRSARFQDFFEGRLLARMERTVRTAREGVQIDRRRRIRALVFFDPVGTGKYISCKGDRTLFYDIAPLAVRPHLLGSSMAQKSFA